MELSDKEEPTDLKGLEEVVAKVNGAIDDVRVVNWIYGRSILTIGRSGNSCLVFVEETDHLRLK